MSSQRPGDSQQRQQGAGATQGGGQRGVAAALAPSFRNITAVSSGLGEVHTSSLFDEAHAEQNLSPLDQYIENTNALNRLYLGRVPLPAEMGPLIVLGYVSAVESYFRALFRGLINVDDFAARLAEPQAVAFGAALHLDKSMLPEALIEEYSFSSSANIKDAIRVLAGVKGSFPTEVEGALLEFQKVCELRHCCVHRFGRLGAKNAIKLGLASHRSKLEKPLKLDSGSLEEIGIVLRSFVKVINNFIFGALMDRSVRNRVDGHRLPPYANEWSWRWRSDKRRFMSYYDLFATELDAMPSPSAKELYDSLSAFALELRTRNQGRPTRQS
ncbi:hypothetical protein LY625_09640 [Lysobacter sp. GX 14042]|uniref:hypothetical protein n=1 Tax=Lysobacter sp. GX 14042 TaxID=2907155 RepID=UPI001F42068B|nr:hypothetical protein [Lysobacter sp. GX 14042]MCE7032869.1 hypothetical protein [Lysobacter sp. GX 14042]